jgi:hypothetical protein
VCGVVGCVLCCGWLANAASIVLVWRCAALLALLKVTDDALASASPARALSGEEAEEGGKDSGSERRR